MLSKEQKMKISGNIPQWLIKACERTGRVIEIHDEGTATGNPNNDYLHDYWIDLADGYSIDDVGGWCEGYGGVSGLTAKDCRRSMLLALGRIEKTSCKTGTVPA